MNPNNSISFRRILNTLIAVLYALFELGILLTVFCAVLAPAFLSLEWGQTVHENIHTFWCGTIIPIVTDRTGLFTRIFSDIILWIKGIIPEKYHLNFIVGMNLWISLESIGYILGIRRFRWPRRIFGHPANVPNPRTSTIPVREMGNFKQPSKDCKNMNSRGNKVVHEDANFVKEMAKA